MKTLQHYKQTFVDLTYPKWKRVGFDGFEALETYEKATTLIENLSYFTQLGVKIYKVNSEDMDLDDLYYHRFGKELQEIDATNYGVDKKYTSLVESSFNIGHIINVPKGIILTKPLIINYKGGEITKNLYDLTYIHIEEGASANVIIRYGDKEEGRHCGLTKVYVERNGNLQLTKLQDFHPNTIHIDNVVSYVNENSKMKYISLELGAQMIVTNYLAYLEGVRARSEAYGAYIGANNQKLDISYKSLHKGRKTNSIIDVRGTLMQEAKKIFRGDLKFNKGAKGSVGKESEYVILLDKTVQSDAIPSLLCDEDDVVGEHAASAGQVDPARLFYLMSRGFNEKEAKKLIIHGSFSTIINQIQHSQTEDMIESILERRLLHE